MLVPAAFAKASFLCLAINFLMIKAVVAIDAAFTR
jgi:hypothetical protein